MINLTQPPASPEQIAAGVRDLDPHQRTLLVQALTVDALPTRAEIHDRCEAIATLALASGARQAMIGGAPWMMSTLERALRAVQCEPVYAFSMRESAEHVQPDGSVRKVTVFRHAGFVLA